jgi:hypothetical protein
MRLQGVLVILLLASAACGQPTLPTGAGARPAPSPTPTPGAKGLPQSTVMQNVRVVRQLETTARPGSMLVFLGGTAAVDGVVSAAGVWHYQFAAPPLYTLHEWQVSRAGDISYVGERSDALHLSLVELEPLINLDSPAAIDTAIRNGAGDYLIQHPDTTIGLSGRYIAGRSIWQLLLESRTSDCGLSLVIDAQTAELLYRGPPCP